MTFDNMVFEPPKPTLYTPPPPPAPPEHLSEPGAPLRTLPVAPQQPQHKPQDITYANKVIWQCVNIDNAPAPDLSRVNGLGAILSGLHETNASEGAQAARLHWQALQSTMPDLLTHGVTGQKRFFSGEDLRTLPPLQWLYSGVIPMEGFVVLYGAPGAGKSFLALHYAAKLSQEHEIIYAAAEGKSGYSIRLQAWCDENEVKAESLKINFVFDTPNLFNAADVDEFIRDVQNEGLAPAMIIFDTLASCAPGADENSTRDMTVIVNNIRRIQSMLGCAVMVLHHTRKGDNTMRGSNSLDGGADVMLSLENDDHLITVEVTKMKDGSAARIEPLTLKVLDVSMHGGTHSTCVLVRRRDVPTDPDALIGVSKKIVDWMASTVFMDGVTDAQLRTLINAPNQTFYRVLGKLLERGIVQRGSNKSSPYYLTDRGKYLAVQHSLGRHRK